MSYSRRVPCSPRKNTRLDLRSNDIHDGGLDALAEGMECNASVERLFVWGNHFGQVRVAGFNLCALVDYNVMVMVVMMMTRSKSARNRKVHNNE